MNSGVLLDIIREYAETIDETLLPTTTISSLGLRLALKLKPSLDEIMKKHESLPLEQRFSVSVAELLSRELDIKLIAKPTEDKRIAVSLGMCRFRVIKSHSLCTIEHGILGGLGFMIFGYCKTVVVRAPDSTTRPCLVDLYIAQTEEARSKPGIEFLRDNIILLKEGAEKVGDMQRRERRKVLLSLFNNLGLALSKGMADQEHVEDFISALSNLSDIGFAVIFLLDPRTDKLMLAAHYGIPEEVLPLAREVGHEIDHNKNFDEDIVRHLESTDWHGLGVYNKTAKNFSAILLRSEDRFIGALVIGLSSDTAMTADFSENLRAVSTLLAASIDNSRLNFELDKAYMDMISMVNSFVTVVDRYSKQHSVHVGELSEAIALQMGLPQEEATLLYQAGFVHDIGKIAIPPEILNKAGKLTDEEFRLIKEHPVVGVKMLAPAKLYKNMLPMIKHHHERLDGSGYPDGLVGAAIPQHARIIAVADVYDAMMAKRAHREAHGTNEALEELIRGKNVKYDPDAVDALVAIINEKEAGERSQETDTACQV